MIVKLDKLNLNMKMFNRTGYVHVRNFFNPKKISYEADKTIEISQKKKWKYIKVYHNIYIFNLINIFTIIFPFNKKLNQNLYKEFLKINLKDLIFKNIGWKNFKIQHVELQHNEKYNYQSTWHRDTRIANLENIVLIIYLKDENGFRLVPKNLEKKMIKIFPFFEKKNYKKGYTRIPEKFYHNINAKAGDILIFDAGLLHQGFCKGKRTHLFIRCKENSNFNTIDDFLKPNADIDNIQLISRKFCWNFNQNYFSFKYRFKSVINLIIYYLPIIKLIKFILDIKKKNDHFHYSFFQK